MSTSSAATPVPVPAPSFAPSGSSAFWRRFRPAVWGLVLVAAVVFPYVVDRPRFWLPNIGVPTLWVGVVAMSLVFLNRYVGLLSLAQMTLAGVAAYGVGYFSVTLGLPIIPSILLGIAAGTASGFLVALIAARTKAIYFLMITLALGQVFYSWASQATEVTNARRGIAPIPRPDLGFLNLTDLTTFYFASLVVAVLAYVLCQLVATSGFGLALQGIRDAPERMRALGYNVNRYRIAALTFAAFIASVGGVILVFNNNQIEPGAVSLNSSLNILIVAVIGGVGSLGGAFVGALILTLLTNFAQNITDRYLTLTGLVFMAILLFAPSGLGGIGQQIRKVLDKRSNRSSSSADNPPDTHRR